MSDKILIWDFDGTLGYRGGGAWTASLLEVLDREEPGHGVTAEQIREHLRAGFPWQSWEQPHPHLADADAWWAFVLPVLERAYRGVGLGAARAASLAREFRGIYLDLDRWCCFEDAVSTLDTLSAGGWQHILLTNHVPELPAILHRLELDSRLSMVFNSAETGYEKPHPQAFEMVLEALPGVQSMWMLGDNVHADVQGAAAFGIPGILVHREHPEAERYCATLRDVIPLLGENGNNVSTLKRLNVPTLFSKEFP